MRAAGVTFCAVAFAAVFMPPPLTFMVLAFVAVVSLIAGITTWAEKRQHVPTVAERLDLHESRVWMAKVRDADADVEAEWARLMAGAGERPLTAALDTENLHRVSWLPPQRRAGAGS